MAFAYEVKKCPAQKVVYWVWLFWQNFEECGSKLQKNEKTTQIFGLLLYKPRSSLYDSRPKIQANFQFFAIFSLVLQNSAKITTPSRQLFALNIFWLHKQWPFWPLNGLFWPFKSLIFCRKSSCRSDISAQISKWY